jgi:hypothetical protein
MLSSSNCPAATTNHGSKGLRTAKVFDSGEEEKEVDLTLAPRLVEEDDLVDDLHGLVAAALRVADEIGVVALLLPE